MYYALGFVASIALFLLFVASRPSAFRIARSCTIAATPAELFARVEDFHRWVDWSPYEKLDPTMKKTFEGPTSGVGAIYRWDGNGKAGTGTMRLVASEAPSRLELTIEFLKPFPGKNQVVFTFEPRGAETEVTWAMEGSFAFVPKMFGVFLNMDRMIGAQFEEGLASLRDVATKKG
jgi:uncharacterized protein YndB with AHSA1/START domain